MSKDFKQYDSRWAKKPYKNNPYNMKGSGCGPTAAACIVSNIKDVDPWDMAQWLRSHGYATNGYGTVWRGIEKAIDAFGLECTMLNSSNLDGYKDSEAEKKWKKYMMTGDYWGILLMGPGKFTGGGHYIAITKYDGKYATVLDPASANRTGDHKWSDFDGDVKVFYVIKKPDKKTSAKNDSAPEKKESNTKKVDYYVKVTAKLGLKCRKNYGLKSKKVGTYRCGSKLHIIAVTKSKHDGYIWGKIATGKWVALTGLTKKC